jgi:uncharacterized membrane protein
LAIPSSALQLVDVLTGKPVTNAKVTADSTEYTSDNGGLVVLNLPDGTYKVVISSSSYLSKSVSVTLPMTQPLTVQLIPVWSIALGAVAGASVAIGVIAKLAWRKK